MLVENPVNSLSFKIGDTVKILSTSQIGTISGIRNGMYQVKIEGGTQLVESSQLEPRQILFG